MLRRLVTAGAMLVALAAVALPISAYVSQARYVTAYLHGSGVAVRADGRPVVLPATAAPSDLIAGSRVLADPTHPVAAAALAADQQSWLADGSVPGAGTRWADMSRKALLDLHVLTPPTGGTAAGWAHAWRYVWPRDAAFVAAAFARTGHQADAQRELAFLQRAQGASGLFEARYLLDGSGPPDERWAQTDGSGWALWATAQVVDSLRTHSEQVAAARPLRALIDRSLAQTLEQTRSGTTLPVPSPDYREAPEDAVTLGTVGPLLAGLQSAGRLERLLGNGSLAGQADRAAGRFAATVTTSFGPTYQRTVGSHDGDAAITFLLPPFTSSDLPGSASAATTTERRLHRPAGGLAPGTDWRDQRVSWTPETALFALSSAAADDRAGAEGWLDWLSAHRTAVGSLPEKVDADGRPAGATPLAWTDALVLLTLATLDD